MLRRSPMKRGRFKRSRPKATDNPAHLKHLRSLPCAISGTLGHAWGLDCGGPVQPHHSTVNKGMSLRTSDLDAFPLCQSHHAQFHQHNGVFHGMTKSERKNWQISMSAKYRPREETG